MKIQQKNSEEWEGFQKSFLKFENELSSVTAHLILPTGDGPFSWCMAVHGATSSKHEWTEFDGYTKGGNLSVELLKRKMAILAVDLRHHGENQVVEGWNVFDEKNWEPFVEESLKDLLGVYHTAGSLKELKSKCSGFISYSMGGVFGAQLLKQGAVFDWMALMVPGINYEKTDPYAAHKNLSAFQNCSQLKFLQVNAEQDEYVRLEDTERFFKELPLENKQRKTYSSQHSLPIDFLKEWFLWYDA